MQLSSGKPLSSSGLGSIFRSWSTYWTGRSEREERGEGRKWGSLGIRRRCHRRLQPSFQLWKSLCHFSSLCDNLVALLEWGGLAPSP